MGRNSGKFRSIFPPPFEGGAEGIPLGGVGGRYRRGAGVRWGTKFYYPSGIKFVGRTIGTIVAPFQISRDGRSFYPYVATRALLEWVAGVLPTCRPEGLKNPLRKSPEGMPSARLICVYLRPLPIYRHEGLKNHPCKIRDIRVTIQPLISTNLPKHRLFRGRHI